MLATRAADASFPIVYVNQVGGQDELVFDGASLVFDADGDLVARAPQFAEDMLVVDLDVRPDFRKRLLDPRGRARRAPLPEVEVSAGRPTAPRRAGAPPRVDATARAEAEVYEALVLGTRDYVRKNGFTDVVIGLSGGIDSSLVAAVAVDALGADHVHGVLMPSRFSSDRAASTTPAALAAQPRHRPPTDRHRAGPRRLPGACWPPSLRRAGTPDLTEENLQARIRGMILMALSNKFGWLVLTTGNKSEMAVGYSTLYGDMAGGFAVIKDVAKTLVYELCPAGATPRGRGRPR